MHFTLPLFLGALWIAQAQKIELDKVATYPSPILVTAPLDVVSDDPPDVAAPPIKPIIPAAAAAAPALLRRARRNADLDKRDGDCSPQPTGAGPVPTPDTAEAFVSFSSLQVRPTTPRCIVISRG